jgi:hypothetical protein
VNRRFRLLYSRLLERATAKLLSPHPKYTLILLVMAVGGCGLFNKDSGSDKSELQIVNTCDVDVSQVAKESGVVDTGVYESIKINPDCTVHIEFRQETGDSVVELKGMETGSITEEPPVEDEGNK